MANRAAKKKKSDRDESGLVRLVSDTKLLKPSLDTIDRLDLDAYVLLLPDDIRPLRGLAGFLDWRLCGRLSALMQSGGITGSRGEKVLTPSHHGVNARRVFVFGWGPSESITDDATERLKQVVSTLKEAKVQKVAVDLPWPGKPLLSLVDEHLKEPLGDKLVGVFEPEPGSAER